QAMKNDAGDRVHHGGEGGDRQNVPCDFDGAFFGGAFDLLNALGMRHRPDVPDVVKNCARVGDQQSGKLAIVGPPLRDGVLVYGARSRVEIQVHRRDVSLSAIEANVALALLLGIVEGMRVEKRPDELAADVFEAELKMRVLVDGVMTTVEGSCANVEALLIGDLLGNNQARGIAGTRRGGGGGKRMKEGVAESNLGCARFHQAGFGCAIEHARLCSHVGKILHAGRKATKGEKKGRWKNERAGKASPARQAFFESQLTSCRRRQ